MKDVVVKRWISFHHREPSFISSSIRTPSKEIFYFSSSFRVQLVFLSHSFVKNRVPCHFIRYPAPYMDLLKVHIRYTVIHTNVKGTSFSSINRIKIYTIFLLRKISNKQ